ncbi:MAG TPA: toprim domain-containing protein, partial [Candidatus Sulfotelmatobacter sp.]|nr:toprim domain-containing protein [Candidatus Sulfotelmatobacter sp.]
MSFIPQPVEELAREFSRLPGIGPKTAQRLTFHCLRLPPEAIERLAQALARIPHAVRPCSRCFFIADGPLCAICSNDGRETTQLCVVEEALDVIVVERSAEYRGLYHVLEGSISPIDGIGPDQLRIA